jgi:hypothetical protein
MVTVSGVRRPDVSAATVSESVTPVVTLLYLSRRLSMMAAKFDSESPGRGAGRGPCASPTRQVSHLPSASATTRTWSGAAVNRATTVVAVVRGCHARVGLGRWYYNWYYYYSLAVTVPRTDSESEY